MNVFELKLQRLIEHAERVSNIAELQNSQLLEELQGLKADVAKPVDVSDPDTAEQRIWYLWDKLQDLAVAVAVGIIIPDYVSAESREAEFKSRARL